MWEQQKHSQEITPTPSPPAGGWGHIWPHCDSREEFMPKKPYRESLLMPSKPSIICKGYIYIYIFSPPEHKEQISTFMKSDLYGALGEWKNKARTEAHLCERRCTMCALTLKVGVGQSQRGYLSLQAAELLRRGVLPCKQRCAANGALRQHRGCLGTFQWAYFSLEKSTSLKSELFGGKGQV